MRLPSIHLNGSSPDVLYEQVCEAMGAIRTAILKLDKTSPNGRDYYPQGMHVLAEAIVEHDERVKRLLSVQRELETLAEYIADQRDTRQGANP